MSLRITPISLREAQAFVALHHRHHKPSQGAKFAIAVSAIREAGFCDDGMAVVGVAIVGRPVARRLDDGWTAEVVRLCTVVTLLVLLAMSLSWPAKAYGPTELPRYWQVEWHKGLPIKAVPDYEGEKHCKHAAAMWSANARREGLQRERSCEDFMVWASNKGA